MYESVRWLIGSISAAQIQLSVDKVKNVRVCWVDLLVPRQAWVLVEFQEQVN